VERERGDIWSSSSWGLSCTLEWIDQTRYTLHCSSRLGSLLLCSFRMIQGVVGVRGNAPEAYGDGTRDDEKVKLTTAEKRDPIEPLDTGRKTS
jgi:hypothetical protein